MHEYFSGRYYKCQSRDQTLAVIPSFHKTRDGDFCEIQFITPQETLFADYPFSAYRKDGENFVIDRNRFGPHGMELCVQTPTVSAAGTVRFGDFTPIRYDIMGPFRYVPFMECRHAVYSMTHDVTGHITLNGVPYEFRKAAGYIEGDRGRSFPKRYVWTQCHIPNGSLMLSVADIPICGHHFLGVIGVVLFENKEYRLATYLGAKATHVQDGIVIVCQRDWTLTAIKRDQTLLPLRAPSGGKMNRTIRENAACRAYYRFAQKGRVLFEWESPCAAFEYEFY